MKLMTLNMRGFFDWDERADHIVRHIRRANPDVIFFQEVVYLPEESPYTQVSIINEALNYPYYNGSITRLQSSPRYSAYREGLAVLSKLPIVSSESVVLKHEEGDPHQRLVQFFDVRDGRSTVKLANIHLSVRDDRAMNHLREVFEILHARGETRILAGDFNMNHLERQSALWRDDYTISTNVKEYVSFPESHESIDYFLTPKDLKIASLQLSDDSLSDHRAITAEIVQTPRLRYSRV